jgi:hypothetical protein
VGFFSDHAADGEVTKFRLYYLGLATPVYWTDCDLDIVWSGHTWQAKPITGGTVSNQPDGASASFTIADADNALFPVLAMGNGGELAIAAIYEAGFLVTNQTAVPDEVVEIFSGRIDRPVVRSGTEDVIEIVLMPPANVQAGELPTKLLSTLVRFTT